jgi:hypothetical protein
MHFKPQGLSPTSEAGPDFRCENHGSNARSDGERNLCRDSNTRVGATESNRRVAVERVEKACWNFEEEEAYE